MAGKARQTRTGNGMAELIRSGLERRFGATRCDASLKRAAPHTAVRPASRRFAANAPSSTVVPPSHQAEQLSLGLSD